MNVAHDGCMTHLVRVREYGPQPVTVGYVMHIYISYLLIPASGSLLGAQTGHPHTGRSYRRSSGRSDHLHMHTDIHTQVHAQSHMSLSTWPAEQRTMVPHSSLALQAHSISKGTRASMGGETPAAVADPRLTKVTHSTLKERQDTINEKLSYHS